MAPQYTELLRGLQKHGGRFEFQKRIADYRNRIASYVQLYEDENKLNAAFFVGMLGEDGLKEFIKETNNLSPQEAQSALDEFTEDTTLLDLSIFDLPETEEGWAALKANFEALSEDEKKRQIKQCALFFGGAFAGFFNTLSLMTHGAKLTTLVPQALAGDDEAFLKAVQIDRLILSNFPYFRDRKQLAQENGELHFLEKLAYREMNPTVRGKIRYPGLYMLFGCLEAAQWLNDLTHTEILDLCDEARLDRYQNRIEDVNHITKRLKEYRRWQRTSGLSMH